MIFFLVNIGVLVSLGITVWWFLYRKNEDDMKKKGSKGGYYHYKIVHDIGCRDAVGYTDGPFASRREAMHKAERKLMEMYTHGIRYQSRYLPPHRIKSSEIVIHDIREDAGNDQS